MKGLFVMDLQALKTQKNMFLILLGLGVLYMVTENVSFLSTFLPMFLSVIVMRISMSGCTSHGQSRFLFTLPFTRRQYVLEKYLISIGSCLLADVVIAVLLVLFGLERDPRILVLNLGTVSVVVLILTSVYIPLQLHFKENAAIWMMLLTGAAAVVGVMLPQAMPDLLQDLGGFISANMTLVISGIFVLLAAVVLISAGISIRLLENEEF